MSSRSRWMMIAILAAPLLVMVLLAAVPRPFLVSDAWDQLRLAQAHNRPEAAALQLVRLVELEPWRADLLEPLAEQQRAAGEDEAARAIYKLAWEAKALSHAGVFHYVELLAENGDQNEARELRRNLVQQPEMRVEDYQLIYDAQLQDGDLNGAEDTLQTCLSIEPNNSWALYRLGLAFAAQSPAQARLHLEKAAADPLYSGSARWFLAVLDKVDAMSYDAGSQLLIGRALASLGEWRLAENAFLLATRANSEYAEAWAYLGEAYQQTGRGGLPELNKALEIAPDSVEVQALVAVYWRRQGNLDESLRYLKQVAALEPQSAIWQVELGNAFNQKGDLTRAVQHYERAVNLEPDNFTAWLALAAFSLEHELDVQGLALPAATQALALNPNDANVQDLLGQVYFALGDLENAERFLQQALQQAPGLAQVHLHLGQIYLQQGKMDQARAELQIAAESGQPAAEIAGRLLQSQP